MSEVTIKVRENGNMGVGKKLDAIITLLERK